MKKNILCMFNIFEICFCNFAQGTIINNSATEMRFTYLEQRINNLETVNVKLLNSIYWTIGSFSVLVIAFIAVNLFASIQAKKKELENIKNEVFSNVNNEISTVIDDRISDSKKNIDIELGKNRKDIDREIATITSKLSSINSKVVENNRNILQLEAEHAKANSWTKFSNYIDILKIDIKKEHDYRINKTLDLLFEYIKDNPLESDDALSLTDILEIVPEKYSILKERIKGEIKIRE